MFLIPELYAKLEFVYCSNFDTFWSPNFKN